MTDRDLQAVIHQYLIAAALQGHQEQLADYDAAKTATRRWAMKLARDIRGGGIA